ncbi:MAG: CBS domain-containing protein [Halobacteriales archaeon]
MDIRDIYSTEFETADGDTRVAEVEATMRRSDVRAVVVLDGDGAYDGLVTHRQFAAAHRDPDTRVGRIVYNPARVDATADIRTVARHLIGSSSPALPVFEGENLVGLISAHDILSAVTEYLGVLDVGDVYTADLVTIGPEATLGEAMHELRTGGFTHLPVIEDDDPVGILSLFDLLAFTAREMHKAQGGSAGASVSEFGGSPRGGFGERSGGIDRMLDLPVTNLAQDPVHTTTRSTSLDEAVEAMLEYDVSSLLVVEGTDPVGIVTTTDVLRVLSITDEHRMPIQITNIDLLDDITRREVADLIEGITRKYGDLSVLEANVHLHQHDETLRGTPLLMARIRLFTDKGHFVGTGEGYGAAHAIRLAANIVEREILEGKEYGLTKKHPEEEEWAKFFGWYLEGGERRLG